MGTNVVSYKPSLLAAILCAATFICANVFAEVSGSKLIPKTEREALLIAECAFRTATKNEIENYKIKRVDATNKTEWVFLILGDGEFARPGYSWGVQVNRKTGKTAIARGI